MLVTRARMQPFVVTLCGLLIYRGIARYYTADGTMGFGYGGDFGALEWLASGRTGTLGLLAPTLANPIYADFVQAAGRAADARCTGPAMR